MIEVSGLTKIYGERCVLDRLTFSLKKGEVLGFLGPNGAGKTTTMRILTGYMPSSDGHAVVAGFDVFDNPLEVKKRIGYLPEVPPIYPEMTVESYLRFAAALKGVERSRVRSAAGRAVERCSLQEVRGRLIRHLSKGYRQRVGLAQAIINDPEVLIMDEPTSGLDPRQVVEIRHLVAELSKEQTIILSTHILPEVSAICDRVLIINRGRMLADDTIESLSKGGGQKSHLLMTERATEAQVAQLRQLPGVRAAVPAKGSHHLVALEVTTDGRTETASTISRFVVESGMGLVEMSPKAAGLEDIFIRLITRSEQEA